MNFKLEDVTIAYRLDCRGHLCPAPILMTEEKVADLEAGEVIEVVFTDLGAKADLGAWCRATGNALLGFRDHTKESYAYIRKTVRPAA